MAALSKIAAALGIRLGHLLEGGEEASTVLTLARQRANRAATHTDKGYGFHLLAAERANKIMQPFIFVAERGKIKPGAMAHCGGGVCIYVLEGRMRYSVGDNDAYAPALAIPSISVPKKSMTWSP